MLKVRLHFLLLASIIWFGPIATAKPMSRMQLQEQVHQQMMDHLNQWYPRCMDQQNGGFHATYADDWTALPDESRGLVFQSRMTWVAAMAVEHLPELADQYRPYVHHGVAILRDQFLDRQHGDLYWELTANNTTRHGNGQPHSQKRTQTL